MIDSRQKYREYIRQDQLALGRKQDARPRLFGDEIWKFEILLRKVEYDLNCRRGVMGKLEKTPQKILQAVSLKQNYSHI